MGGSGWWSTTISVGTIGAFPGVGGEASTTETISEVARKLQEVRRQQYLEYYAQLIEEIEEQPEEIISVKHDYPRINFKIKPEKSNPRPEYISVNKEAVFVKFITSKMKR